MQLIWTILLFFKIADSQNNVTYITKYSSPKLYALEDTATFTVISEISQSTTTVFNRCKDQWNFFFYTSYCYRAYSGKNWKDSEAACMEEGGHLASIHSGYEADFIVGVVLQVVSLVINNTYSSLDQQVWIGLHAIDNWKNWQWTDGSPTDYLNWALNEPHSPGKENCAQFVLSGNIMDSLFHFFYDYNCSVIQKAFVCKMPSVDIPTTTSAPVILPNNTTHCNKGWYFYSFTKYCYRAYPGKSWADSEAVCVKEGGHLASIHSANETSFIVDVTLQLVSGSINTTYNINDQQIWIGLFAVDNYTNWEWSDGTPFDYNNWESNHPNYPKIHNCAQLYLNTKDIFTLNDYNCSSLQKAFVCKIQSLNLITLETTTLLSTVNKTTTNIEASSTSTSFPFHISKTSNKKWYFIIGGTAFAVIFISVLAIFVFLKFFKRKANAVFHRRAQESIINKLEFSPLKMALLQKHRRKMQIDSKNVIADFETVLGRGANSFVYQAYIRGESKYHNLQKSAKLPQFQNCKVALKLPTNFNADDVETFIRELDALITFGSHPHIIAFLGWSLYGETPTLITEKAQMNLLTYVKSLQDQELSLRNISSILWQISQALEHVAANSMVHRDVACRNILMTESTVAKLADFGLCCHCEESFLQKDSLQQDRFPFKWLSIEAIINQKFSEKSDVWAFGILCYEIYVYGSVPYLGMTNTELIEFLQAGNRLEKPLLTPDAIYDLMLACWAEDPEKRPHFQDISRIFRNILENETVSYGYLSIVE